jgi:hypothetical protein
VVITPTTLIPPSAAVARINLSAILLTVILGKRCPDF